MTWQDEFKAAIASVVLAKGDPARDWDEDDWRDSWTYRPKHTLSVLE